MQIYLLKDLKGQGKAGDIINVNDGYGKNFIIKNGIGKPVDNTVRAQVLARQQSSVFHKNEEISKIKAICERLKGIEIVLYAKVGANGKMFGSITGQEVSAELLRQGFAIDKKNLIFEPVKETGVFKIKVKYDYGIEGQFTLEVKNGSAG